VTCVNDVISTAGAAAAAADVTLARDRGQGTGHKPSSDGAILMFEPSGTVTTGDRHEGEIPDHVDSTAGHDLTGLQ
jgi:hypothetical protein